MARRKAKDKPEEKGFEQVGPLDPSYGAFAIPAYPYGAKKPPEPEQLEQITSTKPNPANKIELEWIDSATCQVVPPPIPPESEPNNEGEGTERNEVDGREAESRTPETEAATDPDTTPPEPDEKPGDTLPTSTTAVAADSPPLACNLKRDVFNRLMREGRWWEIAPIRDRMVKEAKASGMEKEAAQVWAYTEIDRLYPPLPPKADKPPPEPAISPAESPSAPPSADLPGLYSIPANWPPLPDNAALQAELGWVQSQRLAVVEERGNATIVRLERASSPAPSKAALGWLETSIRSYAKYIEVAAKTLAGAADEAEATRRERMRLDEIRALLDEMHRDAV